jgi:hypothetical protein
MWWARQDAKQRRDVARDVVDHLAPGRPAPAEEHPAHANKRLSIGLVVDRLDASRELRPTGDDFAMLRLMLLALLPQIGGVLLMIARAA